MPLICLLLVPPSWDPRETPVTFNLFFFPIGKQFQRLHNEKNSVNLALGLGTLSCFRCQRSIQCVCFQHSLAKECKWHFPICSGVPPHAPPRKFGITKIQRYVKGQRATIGREMVSFLDSLTASGFQRNSDKMRKIHCLQTKMKTVKHKLINTLFAYKQVFITKHFVIPTKYLQNIMHCQLYSLLYLVPWEPFFVPQEDP